MKASPSSSFGALLKIQMRIVFSVVALGGAISQDLSFSCPLSRSGGTPPVATSAFHTRTNTTEFLNQTNELRKDKIFLEDWGMFEKYLAKHYNASVIAGSRPDDDFENWVFPKEIKRNVRPFYMSGFDQHNRPIWVNEYGSTDLLKLATGGPKAQNAFYKYMRYICYVAVKSLALKNTDKRPVHKYVLIIDFDGFKPEFLLNPETLKMQLTLFNSYRQFARKYIFKMIVINNQLVLFGTNKASWIPELLKILPKESVPEKYGGPVGFTPLYVVR